METDFQLQFLIVGITMMVTGIVKFTIQHWAEELRKRATALFVLGFAGALNLGFAQLFQLEVTWREALLQGLFLGAVAGGIYSLGKSALQGE